MVTTFPSQSYLSPYTVPFAVQPVGSIPHRPSAVINTNLITQLSYIFLSSPKTTSWHGSIPHCPAPLPSVVRPLSLTENRPAFPNPTLDQFLTYVLQFCPAQTSVCFGCGNTLRQEGIFQQHLTTWLSFRRWLVSGRTKELHKANWPMYISIAKLRA